MRDVVDPAYLDGISFVVVGGVYLTWGLLGLQTSLRLYIYIYISGCIEYRGFVQRVQKPHKRSHARATNV